MWSLRNTPEMVTFSTIVAFWAISLSSGADHGTFKDCSRVDFCANLRNQSSSGGYTVDPTTISQNADFNILVATLTSTSGGSDLALTLYTLQNSTFRLKITEVESSRYELQDVLPAEPEPLSFDSVGVGLDSAAITIGTDSVVINFSPFTIDFNKNRVTELVFDGDHLTMATNGLTAPFSFGLTYPQAVQLYGLHEHCDTLALKNTAPGGIDPYRLKSSDVANYEIESPMALYGAVPVLYGHGPNGTAGVFLHNAAEQWIDTTSQDGNSRAYFMVETGTLDLFVFLGPTPVEVVRQYTALTGTAHLPQLWTLGYHQSRYSYDSDLVKEVVSGFDNGSFQLDSIWLDIDYTDGYKYFTWNPSTFSDPIGLQETVSSTGKKLVTIIDPHIKVEEGYFVYDGALSDDLFVKIANGSVYQGPCWPGTSSYIDFLNPDARQYYASLHNYGSFVNSTSTIAGFWNDMNEPAVFDTSLEMTLPPDALHYGDVRHREIHNIYGFLHTKSTHQGLLERDNATVRPFVLSRSHFAGSQRYAAIWTGDNTADWPYLLAAFQECLTANILGLVFCGADVGGFFNNPTTELLERWYQAGAWLPFYRSHSYRDTNRREPYLLEEDSQEVVRNAIQMRYRHLPVWYTLFFEHGRTGDPIIRPLFYHYPEDVNVYSIDNQLLVGRDILVRVVTEPEVETVDVYFPGGENEVWVSATSDEVQAGNGLVSVAVDRNNIPVYYRQGAAILLKDTVRSNTGQMADDAFTLYYTLDENNSATGNIYVDDGVSFRYLNESRYSYWSITVSGNSFMFRTIDGTNAFPLVINVATRRDVVTKPAKGQRGAYKEKIYTRDATGRLLKDIIMNPSQRTVVTLE